MSATQGVLQLELPPAIEPTESRDPLEAAQIFKRENGAAYHQLAVWTQSDIAAGRRPSMKWYVERLRRDLRIASGGRYKLDNTATAGLVRLLIADYPQFDGYFERRASRADRGAA